MHRAYFTLHLYRRYPYHYRLISVCLFCIGIGNSVSKTIRLMFSFLVQKSFECCESSRKKLSHIAARFSARFNSFRAENLTSCALLMLKIKVTFWKLSLEICIFDCAMGEWQLRNWSEPMMSISFASSKKDQNLLKISWNILKSMESWNI